MSSGAASVGRKRVIDSDSDSDDNVPLSKLRADAVKREPVKQEVKTEVKTEVKQEARPKVKVEVKAEDGAKVKAEDSDSDDDIPIVGLAKRKKLKVEARAVKAEPSKSTGSAATPRALTPRKTKKRIKIKYKQQECTEELYNSLKGRLTQELLCRWWYALEWPPQKANAPKLHGVQELDGYPGAYIRVRGEDMGSIIDTRSPVGKPSFLHFFAMPADQIKELLLKAYEKQMEVLIEHEGEGTPQLKELKKASASAARIDANKADRGVSKVLKKYAELANQIKEEQERIQKEADTAEEEDEDIGDDDDDDDDDDVGQDEGDSSTADDETASDD